MKLILLVAVLALSGCANSPLPTKAQAAIASFNAAAIPRVEADATVAAGAAATGAASEVTSQLTNGGKLDASAIGAAAGVSAVGALINLDIQRAQGTQP